MSLDDQFEKIYDFYQEMITNGSLDGDMYDHIDGIMGLIWSSEDAAGALFYQLDTDADKSLYIQDFKNAVEWLRIWQGEFLDEDYQVVAKNVIEERTS